MGRLKAVPTKRPHDGGPYETALQEQAPAKGFVDADGRMELVERHVLVVGVRDVDGSRPDEDGRTPFRQPWHVSRVREHRRLEAWQRMHPYGIDVEDVLDADQA